MGFIGIDDLLFKKQAMNNTGIHIVMTNLQIVFAILVSTLLGTFLELLGMAVIGLVVVAALMRHALVSNQN